MRAIKSENVKIYTCISDFEAEKQANESERCTRMTQKAKSLKFEASQALLLESHFQY